MGLASISALVLAASEAAGGAVEPDFTGLARRGGIAILLGLLVGAEREHSHTEKEVLFAGIRTFPLIGMLGFIGALLSEGRHPLVFAAVALAFGGLVVASYVLTSLGEDKGATTEISGLMVFSLGAMCYWGYEGIASALAVVATLLLSMREALHGIVARIVKDDIYAALKLAIVTLIVLPLLPDEAYGPYGAWNPHKIWKYVVLIASISFAGYVAVKVFGTRRGIGMTGILGGLASSTAVALAFSRRSREEPRLARHFAVAIVLASTIMFPRVLVTAAVICPPIVDRLWIPVALLTATGAIASGVLYLRREAAGEGGQAVVLKNPFELGSAIKFGLFLAVIFLVSKAAYARYQEKGLYAASALAGLTDVDAITAQASSQARDLQEAARTAEAAAAAPGASPEAEARAREARGAAGTFGGNAVIAIVLAMMANTLVKGAMTFTMGSPELRRYTVPAYGAMVAVGVASAFLPG